MTTNRLYLNQKNPRQADVQFGSLSLKNQAIPRQTKRPISGKSDKKDLSQPADVENQNPVLQQISQRQHFLSANPARISTAIVGKLHQAQFTPTIFRFD